MSICSPAGSVDEPPNLTPDSTGDCKGPPTLTRRDGTLEGGHADHYLILAGNHLYRMNYAELLHAHRERKADVTVRAPASHGPYFTF